MSKKSKSCTQRDGNVDIDSAEPTNKAEEFAELLIYAFGNADVTRKLGEALGVNEQLANLQGELEALRKDVRVRDEATVNLKKEMVTLHDELEQYTRRNSSDWQVWLRLQTRTFTILYWWYLTKKLRWAPDNTGGDRPDPQSW